MRDRAVKPFLTSASGKRVLLFGGISVFLTILAPLGSHEIQLAWRALYWFSLIFFGAGTAILLTRLWERLFQTRNAPIFSLQTFTLILAISVPITLFVELLGALIGYSNSYTEIFLLFFYVVVVTYAVTATTRVVESSHDLRVALEAAEQRAADIHQHHDNQEGTKPPSLFAQRLPVELRQAELVSVSSEDHYLLVTTTEGSEHIRCTMADAANELAEINGRVVHRSHWVAHAAIDHLERTNGRAFVVLSDGRKLPVSRSRLIHLSDEGWLPTPRKVPRSPNKQSKAQDV